MKKLYFTKAGAERMFQEKEDLFQKLRETQGQKGEAAEVGGNQWHDNFSFEELVRQEFMLNKQITELNKKIEEMVILSEMSKDTSHLRIGHIAVLDVGGIIKKVKIGGYGDYDLKADPPTIAYNAPLVSQLFGEEQGSQSSVRIEGAMKAVTLEDILLEVGDEDSAGRN